MEAFKPCEIILMSIPECNSDGLTGKVVNWLSIFTSSFLPTSHEGIKGFMTHLFMCVTHIFATAYAEYMCL